MPRRSNRANYARTAGHGHGTPTYDAVMVADEEHAVTVAKYQNHHTRLRKREAKEAAAEQAARDKITLPSIALADPEDFP